MWPANATEQRNDLGNVGAHTCPISFTKAYREVSPQTEKGSALCAYTVNQYTYLSNGHALSWIAPVAFLLRTSITTSPRSHWKSFFHCLPHWNASGYFSINATHFLIPAIRWSASFLVHEILALDLDSNLAAGTEDTDYAAPALSETSVVLQSSDFGCKRILGISWNNFGVWSCLSQWFLMGSYILPLTFRKWPLYASKFTLTCHLAALVCQSECHCQHYHPH